MYALGTTWTRHTFSLSWHYFVPIPLGTLLEAVWSCSDVERVLALRLSEQKLIAGNWGCVFVSKWHFLDLFGGKKKNQCVPDAGKHFEGPVCLPVSMSQAQSNPRFLPSMLPAGRERPGTWKNFTPFVFLSLFHFYFCEFSPKESQRGRWAKDVFFRPGPRFSEFQIHRALFLMGSASLRSTRSLAWCPAAILGLTKFTLDISIER